MNYAGYGNIRIRTYTAGGALPVEGTVVRIYGTDDYNKDIKYSLVTDSNGITEELSLPAPAKTFSTSPGAKESPYSVYNIEITKNGYYPKRIDNVPIFSGTTAVLPIEMVPLSYTSDGSVSPNNNLIAVIYDNDKL